MNITKKVIKYLEDRTGEDTLYNFEICKADGEFSGYSYIDYIKEQYADELKEYEDIKKNKKPIVEITEDFIRIFDKKGEVVYWDKEEWKEEPNIIISITNAIKMAYEGKDIRKIINKK
jgi:hypothetical protein